MVGMVRPVFAVTAVSAVLEAYAALQTRLIDL